MLFRVFAEDDSQLRKSVNCFRICAFKGDHTDSIVPYIASCRSKNIDLSDSYAIQRCKYHSSVCSFSSISWYGLN